MGSFMAKCSIGMVRKLTCTEQDTGAVDPVKMEMAVAELDMITDVL